MKWLSVLAILPSTALAFQQHVKPIIHHKTTALNFFPEQFSRAEECATHYDSCNIDELEGLASELEVFQSSELQNRDDYKDTQRVLHMLRTQKELKDEMKEYVTDHYKETYMDTAWNNNSVGLGSGLW